jgi:hypothetical protein
MAAAVINVPGGGWKVVSLGGYYNTKPRLPAVPGTADRSARQSVGAPGCGCPRPLVFYCQGQPPTARKPFNNGPKYTFFGLNWKVVGRG